MAFTPTIGIRDEFVNTTPGWVGAVQIGPHGEQAGIAIEPNGSVWLTEDEQILTANAPRSDADNPFIPRVEQPMNADDEVKTHQPVLVLRTKGAEIKSRRPFGEQAQVDHSETGAAPIPQGDAIEGEHAAGEEVGTPAAIKRPQTRLMKTKETT